MKWQFINFGLTAAATVVFRAINIYSNVEFANCLSVCACDGWGGGGAWVKGVVVMKQCSIIICPFPNTNA